MRRFVLCSIGALALAPGSAAQTHRTILTQTVDGAEWAVDSVTHLRFGRVAVVATPDGPRLEVRRLRDVIPTPPKLRIEGATPSFTGNNLVVGDFARSNRSALGGYFSTFARAPSEGWATVGPSADSRRVLTLSCDRADSGFCGLWIQLYDFEASPDTRSYLDGTSFSTLSFWVRGHQGGERLLLKVADARWELKQDALVIGDLADFLPSGRVDTAWQHAFVPLDRFPPRIDRATLALLVWEAVSPGRSDIDLGRVAFSLRPTALPSLPEPTTEPSPSRPEHLATWLCNTRWPVTRRVEVPASKITFARHGARRLREVMDGTRTELGRFPSFAGFALHFAESYLALVGNVPNRKGSDLQQESPGP